MIGHYILVLREGIFYYPPRSLFPVPNVTAIPTKVSDLLLLKESSAKERSKRCSLHYQSILDFEANHVQLNEDKRAKRKVKVVALTTVSLFSPVTRAVVSSVQYIKSYSSTGAP